MPILSDRAVAHFFCLVNVISLVPFVLVSPVVFEKGLRTVRLEPFGLGPPELARFVLQRDCVGVDEVLLQVKAAQSAAAPRRGGFALTANSLTHPFARKLRSAHQALPDLGVRVALGIGSCLAMGIGSWRSKIKHRHMACTLLAACGL